MEPTLTEEDNKVITEEKKKAALLEFAYLGRVDEFLKKISDISMREDWNYSRTQNDRPHPILYNYLNHTFMRLKEQGKIVKKDNFYSFNTGLVTENQQEIFAILTKTGSSAPRFLNCVMWKNL